MPWDRRILVVDDDEGTCALLRRVLEDCGYEVVLARTRRQALRVFQASPFQLAFLDVRLPDGDGLTLLGDMLAVESSLRAIVMTGAADVALAVKAMKLGAFDFVTKPCSIPQIAEQVSLAEKALARTPELPPVAALTGASAAMRLLAERVSQVARWPRVTALILGESGVGKEVLARALHEASHRRAGPFVAVNCGGVAANLLEAELFGYEPGAFTGAQTGGKAGLFEAAEGGTLLLDEIGEAPPQLQATLLRVLDSRRVRRIGSVVERPVDVQILAATNRDLQVGVEAGSFRADLYHRLRLVTFEIPPLRRRSEDILPLSRRLLASIAEAAGRPVPEIASGALEAMERYPWPGNVRELRNALERAAMLFRGDRIELSDLELPEPRGQDVAPRSAARGETRSAEGTVPAAAAQDQAGFQLAAAERETVRRALVATRGNKKQAAALLGISRVTLYKKIRDLDIVPSPETGARDG